MEDSSADICELLSDRSFLNKNNEITTKDNNNDNSKNENKNMDKQWNYNIEEGHLNPIYSKK